MLGPTCSGASAAAGEPLIGSAPAAAGWVCLEQDGPWGAKAWTSSHLDPALGAAIEQAAAAHGVRPSLVRRPGRHADDHVSTSRRVLVAHTRPGASWLLAGSVTDPHALLDLDWKAVATGDRDAVGRSLPSLTTAPPQLLVCTNGTRDTCCARLGRPVAAAAAAHHPDRVWEVTHTSGHRFAPTTVLLPSGSLHGRVLDAASLLAAESEGRVELAGFRGRSTWPPAGQVAEEHVRRRFDVTGLDDLRVAGDDGSWQVSHRDGRRWTVTVTAYDEGERPESCGKESKPVTRFHAEILES
ncbi:sucrase ferredoxin [Nocardioides pocheonensis]|uniref:Sucrase ferredoxin n=1 Tax=Nocardioides pocheonensis TaxID=661485 RepID=A0A3N0GUB5_9ACTN|nr:sucrase ferredoxin [Nocardioides pocheonensis]RNM16063.1 sucrase ferredoxin [Nocardioides pocheonensis]